MMPLVQPRVQPSVAFPLAREKAVATGISSGTTQGNQVSRNSCPEHVTKEGPLASPLVQPRGIQCGATLAQCA